MGGKRKLSSSYSSMERPAKKQAVKQAVKQAPQAPVETDDFGCPFCGHEKSVRYKIDIGELECRDCHVRISTDEVISAWTEPID